MSPVKEPQFISAQFLELPQKGKGDIDLARNIVRDSSAYEALFESTKNAKMFGEASADNLFYHENAAPQIKNLLGNIRIIILLRNPIERAFSSFLYLRKEGKESLTFEGALKEEQNRKNINYSYLWLYKQNGYYYQAVRTYLDTFDQVGIFLYDELIAEPHQFIKRIYNFLGVDTNYIPKDIIKYNASGNPRSTLLYSFLTRNNRFKKIIKPLVDSIYSEEKREVVVERLKTSLLNSPILCAETRTFLLHSYREDILKLQRLINRNLTNWLIDE